MAEKEVLLSTHSVRKFLPDTDALICDGPGAADCHPLINGIITEAGMVKVKNIKTDQDCPVLAWFIPDDESATYPANSSSSVEVPAGGGLPKHWKWEFTWDDLPALGVDATLRLKEMPVATRQGATINYTVCVAANVEQNFVVTEIN